MMSKGLYSEVRIPPICRVQVMWKRKFQDFARTFKNAFPMFQDHRATENRYLNQQI